MNSFHLKVQQIGNYFHLKAIHLCCHCPFGKLEIDTITKQKYQEPGVEAELNLEFLGVLQLHLLKTIWA